MDVKLGKYGYDGSIVAEGFYHYVGFMGRGRVNPITAVGIYNGGACGPYDFYAAVGYDQNSIDFYLLHEKNTTAEEEGPKPVKDTYMLEKFADQFPKFEHAFYAWIEDGMPRSR